MLSSVEKIWPKISVITPSLNHGDHIEENIQSILKQDYPNFEHIVVDGFSKDNTAKVVARYSHINFIQVKSTAAEAHNIGLKEATGDIICFLNTDDYYEPKTFFSVACKFKEDPSLDIVCGHYQVLHNSTITSRSVFPSQRLSFESICFYPPGINSMFFKKMFVQKQGLINHSYTRASDREYLLRCVLNKCKWYQIADIVLTYRLHPLSYTLNEAVMYNPLIVKEHLQLINEFLRLKKILPSQKSLLKAWRGFEKVRELLININEKKPHKFLINLTAFFSTGTVFRFLFFTFPIYIKRKILEYLIHN